MNQLFFFQIMDSAASEGEERGCEVLNATKIMNELLPQACKPHHRVSQNQAKLRRQFYKKAKLQDENSLHIAASLLAFTAFSPQFFIAVRS